MSTSQLLCIAAVALFVCIAAPYAGWATALVSGYLITLGGISTTLLTLGETKVHFGIAPNSPTLWLSDVLLALALLAIWAKGGTWSTGWLLAAVGISSCILLVTVWGNTPEQWSGLKAYATAIIAFGVGRKLAESFTENSALVLAWTSLVVCGVQFVATAAQAVGILLVRSSSSNAAVWISEGRMVGLYDHPSILGKTVFLQLCFLLPLTTSGRELARRLANTAIVLGVLAVLLTVARANIAAIVVALLLWTILSRRATTIAVRLAIAGLIGGTLIALNSGPIAALQARQFDDPMGGYRDSIFDIGLGQIASAPLAGTGPNYYAEVVGQFDRLAATGYPLHNSFLYPVAELGIPLAILVFLPVILTITRTIQRVVQQKRQDVQSAALFSIIPGLIAIAWTGWGLIVSDTLQLWFLAFGFLSVHTNIFTLPRDHTDEGESIERDSRLTA